MAEKQNIASCPDLLAEWDWEKNNAIGLQPENISIGSVKKVQWICKFGHQWEATPNNRSRGQGCPVCAGRKIVIGFNDLVSKHPLIALDWHPDKNEGLLPTQVTSGSNKRIWWHCSECGHEWQTSVANCVAGKGCPVCSRIKQGLTKEQNLVEQKGSFASHYPNLLNEWDYEKNSVDPEKITKDSTRRVWWRCAECGHSWTTTVSHQTTFVKGENYLLFSYFHGMGYELQSVRFMGAVVNHVNTTKNKKFIKKTWTLHFTKSRSNFIMRMRTCRSCVPHPGKGRYLHIP